MRTCARRRRRGRPKPRASLRRELNESGRDATGPFKQLFAGQLFVEISIWRQVKADWLTIIMLFATALPAP